MDEELTSLLWKSEMNNRNTSGFMLEQGL